MSKCPDFRRYNELLIPFATQQIVKNDSYFQSKFTNATKPSFDIYNVSLYNKSIVWVENKLDDNVTPVTRALAIYLPNTVKYKSISADVKESNPTIFIEVGSQVAHTNYEQPARDDSFLLCKDLEYTLEKEHRNIQVNILNPYTNLTEMFNIGRCEIQEIEPLQLGSFNTNFWTAITLMTVKIYTN